MSVRSTGGPENSMSALRKGISFAVVAAVASLLAAAWPADAAVYRWVDASGHVVYSDQPPPGDVKSELVSTQVAPADPNAVKDMANKDLELKRRLAQRADEEKAAEKARATETKRREDCIRLRNNLRIVQSGDNLYRFNDQGEKVYIDDTMRQRDRERIEVQLRESCLNN